MSDSSSSDGEDTWIHRFCGLEGHEMFCEIDKSYIEDSFNLFGLRHWVPNINDSLDLILDRVSDNEASHELMEATCALYGLIHARYVLTTAGLEAMYAKYTLQDFGNCPHFLCRGQSVVPLGVRDEPRIETVKLFCPKCQDIYVHPSHAAQRVDGAYFGTTFPHLFFMTYKSLVPDPPEKTFVPRVFGFRLHARHPSGGAAAARDIGQGHELRLQERRRLRRPHPPQTPSSHPSGAAPAGRGAASASAAAAAAASGAAVAAVGACAAGSSPNNGETGAGAGGGGGKGRAKVGGKGGSVVVRIKEEEELNGTGARTGKGADAKAGAGATAATTAPGGDAGIRGGGVCHESHSTENGNQPSTTRALQNSGAGTGTAGGQDSPVGESKGGGDREQDTTRSGNRRGTGASAPAAGATANGVTASSQRSSGGNATDGAAKSCGRERDVAAGAGTGGNGKGKDIEPSDDNGGGIDGPRRGCRENCSAAAADAEAEAEAEAEAADTEAREAAVPARSGGLQERGTKRFSEMELEAAAAEAVGGGAGGRGVVGRARGKVPRGRNHTSPAAPGLSSVVAADPAGLTAVEGGGGGGSNRRKTRGRSPV